MKAGKIVSAVLSAAIAAASMFGGIQIPVGAATKTVKIVDLIKHKKAKTFGRYAIVDNKMTSLWSGNGFEVVVKSDKATTMRIVCETNDKVFLAAFLDGDQLDRQSAISDTINDIYIDIPKGTHTLRVVRDSQISTSVTQKFFFDEIEFDGEFLNANAETDFYLEVIGDSICCGCGALGVYTAGKMWKEPDDHSAVKGFGYRIANSIGCDYSLVCRGGIGLLGYKLGSQERVVSNVRMQDIYNYTNAYVDLENHAEEYKFERKPGLILIELGANDLTDFEVDWKARMIEFIAQLRQKNGNEVPLVLVGNNNVHHRTMKSIMQNELKEDKNLYSFEFPYGGSGSAALTTQSSGHPSAEDQRIFAEAIRKYLLKEKLIPEKVLPKTESVKKTDGEKKVPVKTLALGGSAVALVGFATGLVVSLRKKRKKKTDVNS